MKVPITILNSLRQTFKPNMMMRYYNYEETKGTRVRMGNPEI